MTQSPAALQICARRAPETIYNRAILPPIAWYRSGQNVYSPVLTHLPYDPAVNAMEPYGLATPNRQRFGGGVDLKFFHGGGLVTADYDLASEIQGEGGLKPENFARMLVGARLDLMPVLGWPLRASGSFGTESTHNADWVAFDSAKIQGGAEYDVWKGGTLQVGYRHMDFNGVLPYSNPTPFAPADPVLLAFGREVQDSVYDQWIIGLRHKFGDDLTLWINYSVLNFANGLAGKAASALESRPNFEVDQGYARPGPWAFEEAMKRIAFIALCLGAFQRLQRRPRTRWAPAWRPLPCPMTAPRASILKAQRRWRCGRRPVGPGDSPP